MSAPPNGHFRPTLTEDTRLEEGTSESSVLLFVIHAWFFQAKASFSVSEAVWELRFEY